jgi:DNA-binding CsgD family transcriptional regulator
LTPPNYGNVPLTPGEWRVVSGQLSLSVREGEIARHILDGLDDVEIGSRLSISPRTVHAHLERLYRKLGIHSRQSEC